MNFSTLTVLDGILALLIVIGIFLGYKRGFFESITKPLKIIAAACLTFVISNPIITAWTRPLFTSKAYDWIYNSIIEKMPEGAGVTEESVPTIIKLLAALFRIGDGEAGGNENPIVAFSEALAAPVGNLIATIVTYLAVFVILFIILSVLVAIIGGLVDSGPLAVIDKALGLLFGLAVAIVISCLVANITGWIAPDFKGGFVYNFFRNFDPFSLILSV